MERAQSFELTSSELKALEPGAAEARNGRLVHDGPLRGTRREREGGMVVGIGTDMIEIERIERSVARYGELFLGRVFTPGEIAYCMARKNSAESLAARFAAKEAGAKALGTGISRGVAWRELEVTRAPGQRPELHLHGRAAEIAAKLGVRRLSLSLTHSRQMSLAVVVAED